MTYLDESYPPYLWGVITDGRNTAADDEAFFDSRVTAQDAPNAANLVSYGFLADPQTAWAGASGIYINSAFRFHWNGTAWVAGLSPAVRFTPVGKSVDGVKNYVTGLGDADDEDVQAEIQRIIDIERANANRTTLVSWLDQRLGIE